MMTLTAIHIVSMLQKKEILISGDSIAITIPQKEFNKKARYLLNLLLERAHSGVMFDEVTSFMTKIDCGNIKAKSTDKADIRIVIHNLATGSKPELGYSIKSKLGGGSTLINSNKDESNFIYKINGINDKHMHKINTIDKFKQKFEYIRKIGGSWSFHKIAGETLSHNLTMLDLGMPRIIAECLEQHYTGTSNSLAGASRIVTVKDPLNICNAEQQPMYEYKIKQFLLAFALGMTVSTPWYGAFNANGGYIVVKEDGDIVCFHFFDRNDLEGYLFHNTKFETPSTARHGFGEVYKDHDGYFIKLNLQVRFK